MVGAPTQLGEIHRDECSPFSRQKRDRTSGQASNRIAGSHGTINLKPRPRYRKVRSISQGAMRPKVRVLGVSGLGEEVPIRW